MMEALRSRASCTRSGSHPPLPLQTSTAREHILSQTQEPWGTKAVSLPWPFRQSANSTDTWHGCGASAAVLAGCDSVPSRGGWGPGPGLISAVEEHLPAPAQQAQDALLPRHVPVQPNPLCRPGARIMMSRPARGPSLALALSAQMGLLTHPINAPYGLDLSVLLWFLCLLGLTLTRRFKIRCMIPVSSRSMRAGQMRVPNAPYHATARASTHDAYKISFSMALAKRTCVRSQTKKICSVCICLSRVHAWK
jgi:hypothetical protein